MSNKNKYMNKLNLSLMILGMSAFSVFSQTEKINLSGDWSYKLDPQDKGVGEAWFNDELPGSLKLPGSLNTNGVGDDVSVETPWMGSMWNRAWYDSDFYAKYRSPENTKVVFWLSPDKYYSGAAWYQKKIVVPKDWKNKAVVLNLERCHWETTLWIDGKKVDSQNSMSVPHRYELEELAPGEHTITLCVDNRVKDFQPGVDAHSISDNTQSNWNGIVGDISVEAHPKAYIEGVKIVPVIKEKKLVVTVDVESKDKLHKGEISIKAKSLNENNAELPLLKEKVSLASGNNELVFTYDMSSNFSLWDEFNPDLYELQVELDTKYGVDKTTELFGLRELGVKGTQITVNNRAVFFRGTLECCIFPKTGFPPVDVKEWERIMDVCKAHGLNHIRFHSWCPPEAAFIAADKKGMYLYVECGSWASDIGSGKGIDEYIYSESRRIVDEYGNHPSFCLFSYGNEPSGEKHKEYLRGFVNYWKDRDSRFLYTTASGWPAIDENDWHCLPAPRIQGWGEGLKSIINGKSPNSNYDWTAKISKTIPTISHEIGQWCVYPDLKERSKYTGVLKAKNFDIFEDRLRDNGILHLADSFLLASGKLQALCYKADIEAALRTKNFAGFQLLDLHDFPGQGSAIVGVLNPFWESKGYITAEEYSEFCNKVVPLARMDKFVFHSGEKISASVDVAQFSAKDMESAVEWQLKDSHGVVKASGKLPSLSLPTGTLTNVGNISCSVDTEKPEQFELVLSVDGYRNRWNIWVYPDKEEVAGDVMVVSSLDDKAVATLSEGGKVLLTPTLGTMRNEGVDSVAVGFSSIFWNTLWTEGQPPHTLGILCNGNHPALSAFPTEYHSDYQWWDAMSHCNAIPLHKLGDVEPIVRIIDDWFTARSLGLIVEVKVGKGKLMICGADLLTDRQNRPEARQLLNSLLSYMKTEKFNPKSEVTTDMVKSILK